MRHRLQHRHRHRIAARQADEPLRAGVPLRLRRGVQPARQFDLLPARQRAHAEAERERLRRQHVGQRAAIGHQQPRLGLHARHRGEQRQHALGPVQRLERAVGIEQPRLLGPGQRRQRVQAERKRHHFARAELGHAPRHVGRIAGGQRAGTQHPLRDRPIEPRALGREQDVAAPGRTDQLRAQAPAALRQPGQRAVRGEVMRVQPVGIDLPQPGGQPRQRLQQVQIATGRIDRRAQRQPPLGGQQRFEFGAEAAAGRCPQFDVARPGERHRPLQQVRALGVADQHQPQGHWHRHWHRHRRGHRRGHTRRHRDGHTHEPQRASPVRPASASSPAHDS